MSKSAGFTAEEKAAMKERAREAKAAAAGTDGEADLLSKIADMPQADRAMAERLHDIIKSAAPCLASKTWYGMPAYAKDGDTICFFQPASKFKSRFAMLGFSDKAKLDDGNMWPAYYAITDLTKSDEDRSASLIRLAVG
ncbi:MAG: DUF1801 domain-containing protein [Chloroflexi bacterium]|nr:DUF1801 domain-containing protein [Chloroflexota bacterium]